MMTIRNVDVIVSMVININDVNRTEWSPVRSVMTQVITKSNNRETGVRFVNHEYDYSTNWTTLSCYPLIITITISRKKCSSLKKYIR